MRVELKRAGGVLPMVQSRSVVVDAATLPLAEARTFEQLVTAADLWNVPEAPPGPPRGPDAFTYSLTIDDGGRRRTVRVADSGAPDGVRALVTWMMRR